MNAWLISVQVAVIHAEIYLGLLNVTVMMAIITPLRLTPVLVSKVTQCSNYSLELLKCN